MSNNNKITIAEHVKNVREEMAKSKDSVHDYKEEALEARDTIKSLRALIKDFTQENKGLRKFISCLEKRLVNNCEYFYDEGWHKFSSRK